MEPKFEITNLDDSEGKMDLDYMDKVIAQYDIEMINQAKSRKEVRKVFLEIIDHTNFKEIQDIIDEIGASKQQDPKDELSSKMEEIE